MIRHSVERLDSDHPATVAVGGAPVRTKTRRSVARSRTLVPVNSLACMGCRRRAPSPGRSWFVACSTTPHGRLITTPSNLGIVQRDQVLEFDAEPFGCCRR